MTLVRESFGQCCHQLAEAELFDIEIMNKWKEYRHEVDEAFLGLWASEDFAKNDGQVFGILIQLS